MSTCEVIGTVLYYLGYKYYVDNLSFLYLFPIKKEEESLKHLMFIHTTDYIKSFHQTDLPLESYYIGKTDRNLSIHCNH